MDVGSRMEALEPRSATAAILAAIAVFALMGSAQAASPLRRCSTGQLHIWLAHTGAAAGTVGGYLAFTNRGKTTCTLQGWPSLIASRPGASTTAIRKRETMFGPYENVHGVARYVRGLPRVVLEPGRTAVAAFTASDVGVGPTGACPPPYRQLRVTPPGSAMSAVISAWLGNGFAHFLPSCTGIYLSMVVPASGMPARG